MGAEPILDYSNSNFMTQIHLKLKLQTPLTVRDYFKLIFPFAMHTDLTAAVNSENGLSHPKKLYMTWNELLEVDGSEIYAEDQPGVLYTDSVDSANYFAKTFHTNFTQYAPESDKYFIFKFNITDPEAYRLQKGGELLQISLYSQSSVTSLATVYDQNPSFGYIFLENQPTELLDIAITYQNDQTRRNLDTVSEVYLDTTLEYPIEEFEDYMRIQFLLSDNSFVFTGTCESVEKTTLPTIAALPADEVESCSIDVKSNTINAIIKKSAFLRQNIIRFKVEIKSPKRVVENVQIINRLLYKYNPRILAQKISLGDISTNPIDVRLQEISFAHGIKPQDNELKFPFKIIRGTEDEAYQPYNGIHVSLRLHSDTPDDQEQRVSVYLKSEVDAYILPNSIIENLPAAPGKVVSCAEVDAKIPQKRKLSCTGVGKLLAANTYKISFRMYLPYDVSEPDIDCTNFGSISIENSKKIEKWDNLFIIGRDKDLLQKYIQQPDIYSVKENIADYIEYLKSFDDVYLLSLTQDFPDYDAEIFPSFFTGNSLYGDAFIPQDHLNFIKYLKTFEDVWILQKNVRYTEDELNFVKYHDDNQLVRKFYPMNILTIPTVNGKNWSPSAGATNSMLSSEVENTDITTVPGSTLVGLKKSSTKQILVFTTDIPPSDLTSFDHSAGSIDYTGLNNVGMLMMMNPNIGIGNAGQTNNWMLTPTGSAQADGIFEEVDNGLNQYMYFKLSISNSDVIRSIAPGSDFSWAIRSFMLDEYGSIYADDKLLDFYICMIDGIEGPLNLQKIQSYVLINGFSLTTTISATLSPAVSNYWTDTAIPENQDGRYVPLLFKLMEVGTGNIANTNNKIALFFNAGDGFYLNKYIQKISCSSTETANENTCRILAKSKFQSEKLYQTMTRFEIEVSDPTVEFEIIFPVQLLASETSINMYVGVFTDPIYANKPYHYLGEVEKIASAFSFSTSTGPLSTFYAAGNSAANFGLLDCTTNCKVGATMTNQKINFDITTTATAHANAQFTYITDYNFFTENSALSAWPHALNSCLKLQYKYQNKQIAQMKYGIACAMTQSTLAGADPDHVIVSEFKLPEFSGKNMLAYGSLSDQNGDLVALQKNSIDIQDSEEIATFSGVTIAPNMKQSVLEWKFTSPVNLLRNFIVKFSAVNQDLIFELSNNAQCLLQYKVGEVWVDTNLQCEPSIPDTFDKKGIVFDIQNLQQIIPKDSEIKIINFGITSGPLGENDDLNLVIYYPNTVVDQAEDIIALSDVASPQQVQFNSTIESSQLILSDFQTNTISKNAKSIFSIKFQVKSKKLWPGEKIVFDLGQYAFDNQFNIDDLECVILNENQDQVSYDIFQLDLGILSDLTITIRQYIALDDPTYYLQCDRFFTTTVVSPKGISAKLLSTTGLTILNSLEVPLPTYSENSPNIFETQIDKQLATPGNNLILEISVKSSKLEVNSKSRIIFIFPVYYAPRLSKDDTLACYYKQFQLSCKVTTNRKLEIIYFPTTIPVKEDIVIQINGVTQPQSYQVGTFFTAFDDDYDDNEYVEYGTFLDEGLQSIGLNKAGLIGTLDIRAFTIESTYLRDDDIKYSFKMNYPSTYPVIRFGYVVLINFPSVYQYVLQDLKPICEIIKEGSDKNHVGICQIEGLTVKMHIKEEVTSGFNYDINILNIRNSGKFNPLFYKWQIEITDQEQSKIYYKSMESSSNYQIQPFLKNTQQNYMEYVDDQGNVIQHLQLIKGVQSPKIFIQRENSEPYFARSFQMSSIVNLVKTIPYSVNVNVGTPDKYLQVLSDTAIGDYAFKMFKEGDGGYYSNLPVLFITFDDRNLQNFQFLHHQVKFYKNVEVDNFLLFYELDCLFPSQDIEVDFYIDSSSANLGVKVLEQWNQDKVSYQRPFGVVPLNVEYHNLNALGNIIRIDYRISGTNAGSYKLPDSSPYIDFTVVQEPDGENVATIAETAVTQLIKELTVECSHIGIFYYQYYHTNQGSSCQQNETHFMNGAWRNGTQNDIDSECQNVYGMVGIYEENQAYPLKLEGLQASNSYTFIGKCVSQTNKKSEQASLQFDTQANGGQLGKLRFDFKVRPTLEQETKISCFLAIYFRTHPQLVTNGNGNYCTQIHYAEQTNYRRRLTGLDGLSCTDPNVIVDGEDYHTSFFYFNSNAFLTSDDLKTRLQQASALECFKDLLQENADGVPEIINIHTAELITDDIPALEGSPIVYSGYQWATMDDLKLQGTGKVFISLERTQDTKAVPSNIQLINGLTSENGKSIQSSNFLISATVSEYNHTFYPLQIGEEYTIYYVIGQESPFDNVKLGEVQELKFTTKAPPTQDASVLQFVFIITIFVQVLVLF